MKTSEYFFDAGETFLSFLAGIFGLGLIVAAFVGGAHYAAANGADIKFADPERTDSFLCDAAIFAGSILAAAIISYTIGFFVRRYERAKEKIAKA